MTNDSIIAQMLVTFSIRYVLLLNLCLFIVAMALKIV